MKHLVEERLSKDLKEGDIVWISNKFHKINRVIHYDTSSVIRVNDDNDPYHFDSDEIRLVQL